MKGRGVSARRTEGKVLWTEASKRQPIRDRRSL